MCKTRTENVAGMDISTNGEVRVALLNPIPRIHNFNQTVILVDSKAAIQAVATNTTQKVSSIIECRQQKQHIPVDSIASRPNGK